MCEVTQIGILLSVLIVTQLAMSTLWRSGSRAWGAHAPPLPPPPSPPPSGLSKR